MQKLRTLSRSIIKDPVYQKVSDNRFKNHKQVLKSPYASSQHASLKKCLDDDKSQEYALQISRYKKAHMISNEDIDPVIVQNRSLVKKMQDIDKRKSRSLVNFKVPHTSKHKQYVQKIKQENKVIFQRIKNERDNVRTKKQLKKQFAEVDKLIMHSRRIKETIKKSKKDKKSINFKLPKQPKDFAFNSQSPNRSLVPLNLR